MNNIYIAGPFFTDKERAVKARIKEHLEALCELAGSFAVADPQSDGNFESWEDYNPVWGFNVWEKDLKLLDNCDYVVAIDWGLYGDCGTAWEIGYAFAKRKEVIVIAPAESLTRPHSVMVANGSENFITEQRFLAITDLDDLVDCDYFASGIEQK